MIDLFYLLKSLQANVNPQQGGHIRPKQNFERWCNEINQELFEELARQWEKNQVISDKLTPFLRSVNVMLNPQPGKPHDIFTVPTDYRYFSSARVLLSGADEATGLPCAGLDTINGKNGQRLYVDEDDAALNQINAGSSDIEAVVRKVDNQRWASALSHVNRKPSPQKPVITAFDGGFKVAPRGLGILVLDYLRPPKDCLFAYTTGTDDQIIYDAANSIPLEWNSNVLPEFLARLASRYGVYVREEFTYQSGELLRAQTKS